MANLSSPDIQSRLTRTLATDSVLDDFFLAFIDVTSETPMSEVSRGGHFFTLLEGYRRWMRIGFPSHLAPRPALWRQFRDLLLPRYPDHQIVPGSGVPCGLRCLAIHSRVAAIRYPPSPVERRRLV